jgi:[ribosomal protein S18]-alanine N-acetyltransferase
MSGMPNAEYANRIQLSRPDSSTAEPDFLSFERMRRRDVHSVAAIERASFPTPYTAAEFHRELSSERSSWWVVRLSGSGWRQRPTVVAYVGYFHYDGCAHVAKIATDPLWRRRGLGEWTLVNMMLAAYQDGASYTALEVRASNTAALALYAKWRFIRLRRIKGYYEDTGDDGWILAFDLSAPETETWLSQQLRDMDIHAPVSP